MSDRPDLQALREAIEEVDREILRKLKGRMALVEGVARAKLAAAIPFRDRPREEQVLSRVRQTATELGLDPYETERLFRIVMEMSISRQQSHLHSMENLPLRVAYQGVEGSPSHLDAQRRYRGRAGGALLSEHPTFREVADAVRSGRADAGILPIENSSAGSINEIYDLLLEGGLTITAELFSSVRHRLFVLPGADLKRISKVLSHPQILKEWEAVLRGIPAIETETTYDTAGAARKVKEAKDPQIAAIATEYEGGAVGLEAASTSVPPPINDYTRYVEISREAMPCPPGVPYKTSFLLVLDDRPGALREVLACLANRHLNLSKLESRPIPGIPLRYRFYVDLEGHSGSQEIEIALNELRGIVSDLRPLGTYPRGDFQPQRPGAAED
jgi:chorismate mutase/prephenate dehydratase